MSKYLFFIIFIFSFLTSNSTLSQENTSSTSKDSIKNFNLTILPVLFFLPETGLGYGGLGLGTFKFKDEPKTSRPSSGQLSISYTTKNQLLIFAPYELYLNNEKWRIVGELGFYKFFYNFYGLGIDSKLEDVDTYDVTFPRFRTTILWELWENISVGIGYELDIYYNLGVTENAILDNSDVIGSDNGGTISNLGIKAFYDNRDNIFFPTSGFFIQASAFTSSQILGSSFLYSKFSLDNRYYQKINEQHVIATNLFIANTNSKNLK